MAIFEQYVDPRLMIITLFLCTVSSQANKEMILELRLSYLESRSHNFIILAKIP